MNKMSMRLFDLLKEHGFRQGEFTLASGKKSDFYIDVRTVALTPEGHWLIGRLMFEEVIRMLRYCGSVDAVAGVELGGCSLASAVSLMSDFEKRMGEWLTEKKKTPWLPAIYVRKKAKEHGTKKLVEVPHGILKGGRVVLLEDVITTGGSTIRAAGSLKESGYNVVGVVVVVDRMEGGKEAIEKELGVPVKSLLKRLDFMDSLP